MIKLQFTIEEVETLLTMISHLEAFCEDEGTIEIPLNESEKAIETKLAKALASYLGDASITDDISKK